VLKIPELLTKNGQGQNVGKGMNYWVVKQEPEDFSWADFVKVKTTAWTGVRNFQARNYLRQMKSKDHIYFYHSGKEKQ